MKTEDFSLGWIAGIVEGEGSIRIGSTGRRDHAGIQVTVGMTDEDIVRRLHSLVGAGRVNGPYQTTPDRKPYWRWSLTTRDDVVVFLTRIRPFMGARRQAQIDKVLRWNIETPRRYKFKARGAHLSEEWQNA